MNLRLLSFLFAAALLGSGCVVHNDGNGGSANVTFAWTFGGNVCADTTVTQVVVTIPGETLQNNGQFPCTQSGFDGITLANFFPGTYDFTLDAYDSAGTLLFTQSGSFSVSGSDRLVQVDLLPAGGANSYDFVSWTFQAAANAPTCGGEITQVVMTVDDGQPTPVDCAAGMSGVGVSTPYLNPGQHTMRLDAEDSSGFIWASTTVPITTVTGQPTSQSYELPWVVGSAAIDWAFFDGSHQNPTTSCTAAGVQTLSANFQDSAGNWIFADAQGNPVDDTFNCSDASNVSLYRALPPGNLSIFLVADGAQGSGIHYAEFQAYDVNVQAGVFYVDPVPGNVLVPIDLVLQ